MVTINLHCPYSAKKHDPVAVVYYRCVLTGGECALRPDDFYYVHNGVALENLPTDDRGVVRISHVATWPVTNEVYICGAEEAAEAAKAPSTLTRCCGNAVGGRPTKEHPWRLWVWKAIYTYSVGQPIAWTVNNETHNGVFDCFEPSGIHICNSDIKAVDGKGPLQGTLYYWHYVNANPDTTDPDPTKREEGRRAKSWDKFTLERRRTPDGNIEIASQRAKGLSPCDQP